MITGQTINGELSETYKVYRGLITQSGTGFPQSWSIYDGITVGATYRIDDNTYLDVTNIGSPNNDVGTYFVATGTIPNSPGVGFCLTYDPRAPIVEVIENTIGNIWFTYEEIGNYLINQNGLFTENKTFVSDPSTFTYIDENGSGYSVTPFKINSLNNGIYTDGIMTDTPIEIRVYN